MSTTARPRELPATEFDETLAAHDVALVEFHVAGCGICASMEPVLGNVARSVDVPVFTTNPRDAPELVDRFRITSTPTLVLLADGEERARLAEGFVGAADLVEFVESNVPD